VDEQLILRGMIDVFQFNGESKETKLSNEFFAWKIINNCME
jgi:hypothetical protein